MKRVGSRLYYSLLNGEVLVNTGDRLTSDDYEVPSEYDDFSAFVNLSERNRNTVGVIEFEFGEYSADFKEGGVITRIDLETLTPLFTYPDPQSPETPQEPQPALSTKVSTLESESTATQAALASTYEALIQSQQETTTTQLALADVYEQLVNMRAELDALKGGDV